MNVVPSTMGALAPQWFFVTMSVVVGRLAYPAWKHGFRLAMMWVVKLATDPGTDRIAYTPLLCREEAFVLPTRSGSIIGINRF